MGLRGKLGLIFLAVSSLAILALGAAVYTQAQAARLDRARTTADERLRSAAALYAEVGTRDALGAKVDDPSLPAELRAAIGDGKRVTLKTETRLWAAQLVDGHTISVDYDYENSDASMDALERALLLGGIGSILGVALVSVVAAGSLSRRIVAVSGTARRIARGDLDASAVAAVGQGRDEVASLAQALDTPRCCGRWSRTCFKWRGSTPVSSATISSRSGSASWSRRRSGGCACSSRSAPRTCGSTPRAARRC